MRRMQLAAGMMTLCLALACRGFGQEHAGFENECDSLHDAIPPDLVQYLNGVVPDEKNGDCVAWAIKKLGKEQYEPAIPVLTKLLDFRRPPTPREKQGIYLRIQGVWEIYPAAGALEVIGKKTLPAVLAAITASSSSETARHNAVTVWMEIHREGDKQPNGIALLKQEEAKAKDEAIKRRLEWAVQEALKHCNPPEEAACKTAAKTL